MTVSAETSFSHITDWVFDLDNTLYPRTCNLFAQIDSLITDYVADVTGLARDEARVLQKAYYRDNGTTLNGLMAFHGVDPDHYLSVVHAIDYSPVEADPALVEAIRRLPGRKLIFTNADTGHAESVLHRLGAIDLFDGIFDIRATGYTPKPEKPAYDRFLQHFGVAPDRAVMFDDLEKNLKTPHELGMRTVQVIAGDDFVHSQVDEWELVRGEDQAHIHHITEDLGDFLRRL